MHRSTFRRSASLLVLAAGAALLPVAAQAQSTTFTAPNVSNNAGESEATLNGTTFTNQGMVGAGRLPANTRDFAGETLGSFSGMALDLANWRRGADGSYTVTMYTLPDRRPNDAGWDNHGQGATSLSALDAHTQSATMGIDLRLGEMARIGAFGGYRQMEGTLDAYAPIHADGYTFGGYGALYLPMGLYAEAAGAVLTDITLDQIARHSAYGQQALGSSTADGWAGSAAIGWAVPLAGFKFAPFVAVDYSDIDLAGYSESGASVSYLIFAERSFARFTYSFGAEVAAELGMFRPSLRGGYAIQEERGDEASSVRLTSAQHTLGTQNVALGVTERDAAFGEARLAVHQGALTGFVGAGGRWGRGEDEANATIGVAIGF